MASNGSTSPVLPAFGINDLHGPSKPAGLISITRRQYDNTIKSHPDAKLLYIDEDDGELITVGSSLELSQRLEEPVPEHVNGNTSAATKDPTNGRLVHLFDIKTTGGGLMEWKDHEAYSSKKLRVSRGGSSSFSSVSGSEAETVSSSAGRPSWTRNTNRQPISETTKEGGVAAGLPEERIKAREQCRQHRTQQDRAERNHSSTQQDATAAFIKQSLVGRSAPSATDAATTEVPQPTHSNEPLNILKGLDKHLSCLADVLQFAATTLQKAAEKTRETDTIVVEDILQGVKGILTEVGNFGAEALKDLKESIEEESPASSPYTRPKEPVMPLQDAVPGGSVIAQLAEKSTLIESTPSTSSWSRISETPSTVPHKKLCTDRTIEPASQPYHMDTTTESIAGSSEVSFQKPKRAKTLRIDTSPSILDDSSEDAEFTARFPPLRSVRKTRSMYIGELNSTVSELKEKDKAAKNNGSSVQWLKSGSTVGPILPIRSAQLPIKMESSEAAQKPLPGAWPDAKNDSALSLPVSTESSGAFFNRMTGRAPLSTKSTCDLRRANTTASSNPASRLNGPFDPGFAYEPSYSSNRHSLSSPFQASPQSQKQPLLLSSGFPTAPKLDTKHSAPNLSQIARPESDADSVTPSLSVSRKGPLGTSKFDSHMAVKHHRSVPHFRPYAYPPPPPSLSSPRYKAQLPPPLKECPSDLLPCGSSRGPGRLPPPPPPIRRSYTTRPTPMFNAFTANPPPPPPFIEPFGYGMSLNANPKPPQTHSYEFPSYQKESAPHPSISAPPSRSAANSPPVDSFNDDSETRKSDVQGLSDISTTKPSISPQGKDTSKRSPASLYQIPSHPSLLPTRDPTGPFQPSIWDAATNTASPLPPRPISPPFARENTATVQDADKSDLEKCVDHLKELGFGVADPNLLDRLHVYAIAADGNVADAVEMIEEDRRMVGLGTGLGRESRSSERF